jgi:acetoin utilization deacetylase AcuC-like enzyme
MIIFNDRQKDSLKEFGILIPISDSKSRKAIEYLVNQAGLKKSREKWLVTGINEKITKEDLLRSHSEEYINNLYSDKLKNEIIRTYELVDKYGNYHRYDPDLATLPFSFLRENVLNKVAGTVQCLRTALKCGFCFYFGGGMHHAKFGYGEGFCLVNDIVIALRKLQYEGLIRTAWLIDVDAHKGDGTAYLLKDDTTIVNLSIHMAKGWPLDGDEYIDGKLNPSFVPSKIEIPVEKGADSFYNEKLKKGLEELRSYPVPEVALVVLGSDPFEEDELSSSQGLKLTLAQMKERDLLIYNFLKELGIPQAHLMAGGYGENSWKVYAQFLEYVLNDRHMDS